MPNLTRIKNNQITDNTIVASTKIVPGTITGGLLSNTFSYTGDFNVTGNLTVSGTATTIDTTNTTAADPLIVLNKNAAGSNTYDIGIVLERGTSTNTAMIWDETNDQFAMIFTTEVGSTAGSINNTAYADLKIANLALTGAISGVTTGTFGNISITNNTISSTDSNGNISIDPNGAGNIFLAANTSVTGSLDVSANIANANVILANTFTSNVTTGTAPFVINSTTQVANLNVATAGNLINGTTNVSIPTTNGNVTVGVGGNADILIVTSTGANIAGTANITGNANVGNLGTSGKVIASTLESNVATGTAPFTVASTTQVANLNVAVAGSLINGTSNVTIPSSGGNINLSSGGNANVVVVTATGANVTGNAAITGNVEAGNLITVGNVYLGATQNNQIINTSANSLEIRGGWSNAASSGVALVAGDYNGAANWGKIQLQGNVAANSLAQIEANITNFTQGGGGSAIVQIQPLAVDATNTTTGALRVAGGAGLTGNLYVGANLSVSANANVGNLGTSGKVIASTLESNVAIGTAPLTVISTTQVANLNVAVAGSLINGTSNVAIPSSGGNINLSSGGNANVVVVTASGANITGTANVSGNLDAGNLKVNGNSDLGSNANVKISGGSSGYVLQTDGSGNLNWYLVRNDEIFDGNSNVSVAPNSNVSVSVAGNANVVVFTGTGANVNGYLTVTGNVDANNLTVTNNLYVNGSQLDTDSTTFNLANANATTLNIGGSATTVNIGATTGNTVIQNDLQIIGGDIRSSTGNVAITIDDKDVTIAGNLVVQGTRTEVGTTDLSINDSLINLHTLSNLAPLTVDDGRDIGIVFHYFKASDKQAFLGWANDTGALEYYSEGLESNTGVFSGQYGTIKANIFQSEVSTGTAPLLVKSTTQVANLNVAVAGSLINGTSNVDIPAANGNINLSAGGNANVVAVTAAGANVSGTFGVTGNANVGNLGTAGIDMTANINGANVVFANTFTSNVTTGTAPFTVESTTRVANLNVATAGSLVNGNSNVSIPSANSDVTISSAGNANVVVITGTGANITGTANITGNANVGNLGAATVVTTTAFEGPLFQNGTSNVGIVSGGNVTVGVAGNAAILTLTGTGANIAGTANVTGNANVGNLGTSGTVIASTLQSNVATGTAPLTVSSTTQVANLNVAVAGSLINGTSNVAIPVLDGNINFSSAGNANVLVVTGVGANITGTANVNGNLIVTGNANVGNLDATGIITGTITANSLANGSSNVTVAPNGNITLSVTGNANIVTATSTGANISGYANVTGNLDAGNVSTNIAVITTGNITNLNATVGNITTINSGLLQNGNSNVAIAANGDVTVSSAGNANVLTVNGTTVIANADIATKSTTANLFNANATTINFGGGATAVNIGSTTGTTTVKNNLTANANLIVTNSANISNIYIINNSITTVNSNADLEIDANGSGNIVLNKAADDTNIIINGNNTSGYTNLLYVKSSTGQVGIRTNNPTTGTALDVNANTAVMLAKGTTGERPAGTTGMIRYNTTENVFEYYDGIQWLPMSTIFTIVSADSFVGDGSTLAFTLSQSATTASTIISINGVIQIPTTAYTVSGTTLTFTEAPLSTDVIDARVMTTTTTVARLKQNDTEVIITDTGSNGKINLITENVSRADVTTTINVNTAVVSNLAATSVGTGAVVIDSFPAADYRTARYTIQVSNSGLGEYEATEILVTHNGTTASKVQTGIIYTGASSLGTSSVAIVSGNVELSYTGANSGNQVKIFKEYIKV